MSRGQRQSSQPVLIVPSGPPGWKKTPSIRSTSTAKFLKSLERNTEMNKIEAAVIRRFKTPANFMREIGLPARMAHDEAPGEESSAVELIANLINSLDPSEVAEVAEYLRGILGDSRGFQRAARDSLERKTTPPDEVGDRRGKTGRDL